MSRIARLLLWTLLFLSVNNLQAEASVPAGAARDGLYKVSRATLSSALSVPSAVRSAAILHLRESAEGPLVTNMSVLISSDSIVPRSATTVYDSPDPSSTMVARVDAGTTLVPLSVLVDGSWIRVSWNGRAGWVQASAVD